MTKTSVLLIVYNRANLAEQQLQFLISQPQIQTIYVAGDGPKSSLEDQNKVKAVEQVVENLSATTKKKILTKFCSTNQGCRQGVETAINWFFNHESEGIILEDDCKPNATFFTYCRELLERYRTDLRVGMISGTKPFLDLPIRDSYFFSHHSMVWGWATWKRAWQDYQFVKENGLSLVQDSAVRGALLKRISTSQLVTIEKVLRGEVDTWDYIWYLTNLLQSRYCILPKTNLISNVGFNLEATHTKLKTTQSKLQVTALTFPLTHPTILFPNQRFEDEYLKQQQKWRVLLSVFLAYGNEWQEKLRT